jgi:hypothetical protein
MVIVRARAMTEDKWKTLWSILVGATIITLIALVAYQ